MTRPGSGTHRLIAAMCLTWAMATGSASAAPAPSGGCDGTAVQVLGSGGPIPDGERASSAYLIWVDGRARVLVDIGGGSVLRFGASGARLEDLSLIALTHLHADHTSDLPALIKAGYFSERSAPLPIAGPSGGGDFPGLTRFLDALFSLKQGAYIYLSDAWDGGGGQFSLSPVEVKVPTGAVRTVLDEPGLRVEAATVRHGPVPALGYKVRAGDTTFAFSGDQNGDNPTFWTMVGDADVLVMHMPIPEQTPEQADPIARLLHAPPSVIGERAQEAGVGRVVLSHLMPRSLAQLDRNVAFVREHYRGPVEVAADLRCYPALPRKTDTKTNTATP